MSIAIENGNTYTYELSDSSPVCIHIMHDMHACLLAHVHVYMYILSPFSRSLSVSWNFTTSLVLPKTFTLT